MYWVRLKNYAITALMLVMIVGTVVSAVASFEKEMSATPAWPQYQYDAQNTGRSQYIGAQDNVLQWSFQTTQEKQVLPYSNYSITVPCTVGENGIIIVSSWGKTFALDIDGALLWENEEVVGVPSIGSERVIYVASTFSTENYIDNTLHIGHQGAVYAFDYNGDLIWMSTVEGTLLTPLTLTNDTIYFGSRDNRLYALSSDDGALKWYYETGGWIRSPPAIGPDETIYVGSADNRLYAINPDGTKKWGFETGGRVYSHPTVDANGVIYFSSMDNKLYALYDNRDLKWFFEPGGRVGFPSLGQNTIYFRTSENRLYALNHDGELKWSVEVGPLSPYNSAVVGKNDIVYFTSGDNKLRAVSASGKLKWSFDATGISALASWDGGRGGEVYTGMFVASPVIGSDGVIYVGTLDGKLLAIGSPVEQPQTQPKGKGNDIALLIAGIFGVIIALVGIALWLKRR